MFNYWIHGLTGQGDARAVVLLCTPKRQSCADFLAGFTFVLKYWSSQPNDPAVYFEIWIKHVCYRKLTNDYSGHWFTTLAFTYAI